MAGIRTPPPQPVQIAGWFRDYTYPAVQTCTAYGHSFTVITIGHPSTTLSALIAVGATTATVAAVTALQVGHYYTLRDATTFQNPETVRITGISGTTVTFANPVTVAKASGALLIDPVFNMVNRANKIMGDPAMFVNRGIGGAVLMRGGATTVQGGFNTVMQLHPTPPGGPAVLGDPSPGVNIVVWGVNDIGLINGTTITQAAVIEANRHCIRAVQARLNCCYLYDDTVLTSFVTFSGTNAPVASTTQNSGATYRTFVAGTTATYAVLAAPAGVTTRYVDFCFLGNYVGGTIPASVITFTLDGVEVFPVGSNASGPFSATNRFTTVDVCPPITSPTGIPCVARFAIDANAHSLVASAGTGGAALDWVGLEADYCAPSIWANVGYTPGMAAGGSAVAQLAGTLAYNTMLAAVVAEFSSTHLAIADMYTAISPAGVPIARAWSTALDTTHPNTYGNGLVAQALTAAWRTLVLSDACKVNL